MKAYLLASSMSGLVIVAGESVLNGIVLSEEWLKVFTQLGLPEPPLIITIAAVLKLFILGYVVIWLYQIFKYKYSSGLRASLYAGWTVSFLVWCWCLLGLWFSGYVNTAIVMVTLPWGFVELGMAGTIGAMVYEYFTIRTDARRS